MSTTSPNIGLNIPVGTDTVDFDKFFIQNFNAIDGQFASGTTANRPSSPKVGQRYFNTDFKGTEVWDGTVWEPVNTHSYAFVNNSTAQNYPTINTWQQIAIGAGDLISSSDITIASNTLTLASDGIYDMSLEVEISGLNSGVFGNILIRVIPPAGHGSAYDYSINRQGGTGYGGNNGGIWMATSKIDKLWAGTQVYFMTNIGEAPRTIMHCRAKIQKISKF
jgi:hypothetical protein